MPGSETSEPDRIRAAYRELDASPPDPRYRWANPGYRLYMQRLESDLLEALAEAKQSITGRRVLEVGCGSGYFLARMLDYGAVAASGIDLMGSRVKAAQARYPQLELVTGDAGDMPFEDMAFDLVSQYTCMSSILDPALRARVAGEMWRVLAPGGAIVSYDMRPTPLPLRLVARVVRGRQRGAGATTPAGTPTTPISRTELRRLFPAGEVQTRSASLHIDLGFTLAQRSPALARWAVCVPMLRTHLMAIVVKPA